MLIFVDQKSSHFMWLVGDNGKYPFTVMGNIEDRHAITLWAKEQDFDIVVIYKTNEEVKRPLPNPPGPPQTEINSWDAEVREIEAREPKKGFWNFLSHNRSAWRRELDRKLVEDPRLEWKRKCLDNQNNTELVSSWWLIFETEEDQTLFTLTWGK